MVVSTASEIKNPGSDFIFHTVLLSFVRLFIVVSFKLAALIVRKQQTGFPFSMT